MLLCHTFYFYLYYNPTKHWNFCLSQLSFIMIINVNEVISLYFYLNHFRRSFSLCMSMFLFFITFFSSVRSSFYISFSVALCCNDCLCHSLPEKVFVIIFESLFFWIENSQVIWFSSSNHATLFSSVLPIFWQEVACYNFYVYLSEYDVYFPSTGCFQDF